MARKAQIATDLGWASVHECPPNEVQLDVYPSLMAERLSRYWWAWVAAGGIVVAGVAWLAVAPTTLSYWLGSAACLPFVSLIAGRATRKGFAIGPRDPSDDSGPWSAP